MTKSKRNGASIVTGPVVCAPWQGIQNDAPQVDEVAPRKGPVRESVMTVLDSGDETYLKRILIGTPVTGLVRIEWAFARFGQIMPVNWTAVSSPEPVPSIAPLRYTVADAQNIIVHRAVQEDYEWLLLLEHDVVLPVGTFVMLDEYMREGKVPVVSGLYYTRSRPSMPLIFRGRGNGVFLKWSPGDLVWCDGVPTGILLIHSSLLKVMYHDSPEYVVKPGLAVRRVFDTPARQWYDPETRAFNWVLGTSDLEWCSRVMREGYFKKAGWPEYQKRKWPFLVDTRMVCGHINPDGGQFPPELDVLRQAVNDRANAPSLEV